VPPVAVQTRREPAPIGDDAPPLRAERPGHYGRGNHRRKPLRFRGDESGHRVAPLAAGDRPDIPIRRGQGSLPAFRESRPFRCEEAVTGVMASRSWPRLWAMAGRATTATRRTGKERSAATASQTGTRNETTQAIRPSNHNPASSANAPPLKGSRPVQFGIAVSRKPATAAITSARAASLGWSARRPRP
jgi:hypothetical protein